MTLPLPLRITEDSTTSVRIRNKSERAAIEEDGFPFEEFSDVAELESWRKEINRPLYHMHKWWAQRLGSVFRAIVIGALTPAETDVKASFHRPVRFPDTVVFDPFMGSGTTVGEALKLGCRAIGRDINPVAHFIVKNALALHPRTRAIQEFKAIERDVAARIRYFYEARLPGRGKAQCLYYFWVKVLDCPNCKEPVDLFNSYVFARHADPRRYPIAQAVCPSCGALNQTRYDADEATCDACRHVYDPNRAPANGAKVTCPHCRHVFPAAKVAREAGRPPEHRLYAKLVLTASGEKRYLPADDFDRARYQEAVAALKERGSALPEGELKPGYNTNQAINYGYRRWREMFNERQLLCLDILADRIRSINGKPLRDLFICLFSGVLEFNNMFASYKGEGTGAVRHMFSHHILKPERTPLEANPWGTPRSSGAFSTLFESRVLRAIDYCEDPFEIAVVRKNGKPSTGKVFGLSEPIGYPITESFDAFNAGGRVYLSCGDSGNTELSEGSVDAVITDPPFFDNVHYSQLADFFHVWQQYILEPQERRSATTRSEQEVQQTEAREFTTRLRAIWRECRRVMKPGGLLVFTYHHSRPEGWICVFDALTEAGMAIVAAHPIKAEMSVAMPKNQAREPIDLDIILVCRKQEDVLVRFQDREDAWTQAVEVAGEQISRLRRVGRKLSRNDVRVVVTAQIIRFLSTCDDRRAARAFLEDRTAEVDDAIDSFDVNATGERGR